ncbi:MAG: PCP reductase family protein [Deltaproteobacteria bacterium]|nr:PCP reductase family protein [Deltaproteobacteria bacterium]
MADIVWTDDALRRLERVPQGFMRNMTRSRIEGSARGKGIDLITLEFAEDVIGEARGVMTGMMGRPAADKNENPARPAAEPEWTPEAIERLKMVPEGFMRDMTMRRIEKTALDKGISLITIEVIQEKYDNWAEGSAKVTRRLPWAKDAEEKIERIPSSVRGMVIKEVETLAERSGKEEVTLEVMEEAKKRWEGTKEFHK